MKTLSAQGAEPTIGSPAVFPLVRHLSLRLTPVLARLPVTANQITATSLASGLACAWLMTWQTQAAAILGAFLLVLCYVLDNCDGEIARLMHQSSEFGRRFDTFVDWLVHAAFFAALGWGVSRQNGLEVWLWLGLAATAGATINYALGLFLESRDHLNQPARLNGDAGFTARPRNWVEWLIYVFRELARADFCFVVLLLACFDSLHILLPLAALGAHVYWLTQLVEGTRNYHV